MGVEIIYFVKILSDSENPYREISVSLNFIYKQIQYKQYIYAKPYG